MSVMNKNLKKVVTGCLVGVASVSLLVGCSQASTEKQESKKETTKYEKPEVAKYEKQDANNFFLNVEKVESAKSKGDKTKVIVTMSMKNNSSETQDIGAIDFEMKAGDKTYDVDPNSIAFGQPVKAGETLKGDVTFVVPDSVKEAKVMYKPQKESLAEWTIKIQ